MQTFLNKLKKARQHDFKKYLSRGLFITGTDTNVGKTHVACQIVTAIRLQIPDLLISTRKPIASGCVKQQDGNLFSEDTYKLQQANLNLETIDEICPYRFAANLSPAVAIQQAKANIKLTDLINACKYSANHFGVIEGAGGIYSPLTSDSLNIHLAQALRLDVVLVIGNKLGCINHALLSIEAIENHGLNIAHVFLNETSKNIESQNSNLEQLQSLSKYTISPVKFKGN